ncbi:MAG: T9SS type A sorting domain-containing protein [candidate division Zixibacteria bacterium]|nr:T9SS type A sorting domain-containing protein [candidate division Zixibacteria bacterium]
MIWGQTADVPVFLDSANAMMDGFDLLIAYDRSALRLKDVMPGPDLFDTTRCGWEYFSYRPDTTSYPDSLHPLGLVRISAIADTRNGGSHSKCEVPRSLPMTIATLQLVVTNDRNIECWFFPVNFVWSSCFDNTISQKSPRRTLVSTRVLDTAGAVIEASTGLPSFSGAPDFCLGQHLNRNLVSRSITFQNGGVPIICRNIDSRGDINLNGVGFEMADYVMYRDYFLEGLTAFGTHPAGSMAVSDVNNDGITLTISDLMQLYRIVTGLDAPPRPPVKHSPNPTHIMYDHTTGRAIVSTPDTLGAVRLVFNGMPPDTVIGPVEILDWKALDGQIRVLLAPTPASGLYPMAGGVVVQIQPPPSSLQTAEVSTINAGTVNAVIDAPTSADGQDIAMPLDFTLHQNYPNPFNLSTTLGFELPAPGKVRLEILNALGQIVRAVEGTYPAGYHTLVWDGSGDDGRTVSSGIYYARLTAGQSSAVKKMVLLK